MPSSENGELRIGLSRSGIALLQTRGWLRRRTAVLAVEHFPAGAAPSTEQLAEQLDRMLATNACGRQPARLVVADHWVRHWMVTPPRNAARLSDCHAAAAVRFQALFGESMAGWQSAADWHARSPFLASAMPQSLLAAITSVGAQHQLNWLEVVPQFVAGWNRWGRGLRGDAWFGVVHGSVLTLGAVDAGRLRALRSLTLPEPMSGGSGWLQKAVQLEALRWMLPPPVALGLCGDWNASLAESATADWTCRQLDAECAVDADALLGEACAVRLAATGLH